MTNSDNVEIITLDLSPHPDAVDRYEWQGELQTELIEKIKLGLDSLNTNNRMMFASDIFDLLAIAVYERERPINEIWEMINSRMGQQLALYFKGDLSVLPDHIKTEIVGMLEHVST